MDCPGIERHGVAVPIDRRDMGVTIADEVIRLRHQGSAESAGIVAVQEADADAIESDHGDPAHLAHSSVSARATTPSCLPKTANTALAASMRTVAFPRSNSETRRVPTPANSASST